MQKKKEKISLKKSFEKIRNDLKLFIDLSQKEDEISWMDWISSISTKIETKCWERKQCNQKACPAYQNPCGRCWIIAGSMLPGEIQCEFATRYESCKNCEVYQDAVYRDPITEVEEYLIVLVHSLRSRQQELKEIATTDFLTNLYNRRFFETYIQHEHEKLKRSNKAIIIMMIDINGFKEINDQYGHVVGDEILQECAQFLSETTRQSDLIARYGGDEFVLVLHEYNDQKNDPAVLIARIEEHLANRNALNSRSGPAVSMSFGYAMLTRNNTVTQVIKEADENMYQDKKRRKTAQLYAQPAR